MMTCSDESEVNFTPGRTAIDDTPRPAPDENVIQVGQSVPLGQLPDPQLGRANPEEALPSAVVALRTAGVSRLGSLRAGRCRLRGRHGFAAWFWHCCGRGPTVRRGRGHQSTSPRGPRPGGGSCQGIPLLVVLARHGPSCVGPPPNELIEDRFLGQQQNRFAACGLGPPQHCHRRHSPSTPTTAARSPGAGGGRPNEVLGLVPMCLSADLGPTGRGVCREAGASSADLQLN
ncbi:hypothetical protein ABH941_007323 [Streptacidiphilus sp. EB103A]